jgi:hypothetical protein
MLTPLDLTICSDITRISHPFAEVWIAKDEQTNVDYAYGGTRLVSYSALDEEVEEELKRLTLYESSLKNRLINFALRAKQESLSRSGLHRRTSSLSSRTRIIPHFMTRSCLCSGRSVSFSMNKGAGSN